MNEKLTKRDQIAMCVIGDVFSTAAKGLADMAVEARDNKDNDMLRELDKLTDVLPKKSAQKAVQLADALMAALDAKEN